MLVRSQLDVVSLLFMALVGKFSSPIMPSSALSFFRFDQIAFNAHVNAVSKKEILNPKGICYGYHTTHFAYSCLDQEEYFDKTIQAITEAKEFKEPQINFIDTLKESQSTNAEKETAVVIDDRVVIVSRTTEEKPIMVHNDARYQDEIKQAVEKAIDMAIIYFGDQIGLHVFNGENAHVIGITAKKVHDKIILQYDDPNYFIKVKFDNAEAAISDITQQLCFGYYHFYSSTWAKKQSGSIHLGCYHAECDEIHSSTKETQAWAREKRNTFFRAAPKTDLVSAKSSEKITAAHLSPSSS